MLRQLQQLGDILECRPPKQLQQPELRPLLLALYLEELPAALRLLPTTTTTTSRSMDPWALEAARGLELLLARGLVDPSEEVTTTAALAAFEQLAQLCCGRAEAQAQAAAAGGGCAGEAEKPPLGLALWRRWRDGSKLEPRTAAFLTPASPVVSKSCYKTHGHRYVAQAMPTPNRNREI